MITLYALYILGVLLGAIPYHAEVQLTEMAQTYELSRVFNDNGEYEGIFTIELTNENIPGTITALYNPNPEDNHTLFVSCINLRAITIDCQAMFDRWKDKLFENSIELEDDYYKTYFISRDRLIVNVDTTEIISELKLSNTPHATLVKMNDVYLQEGWDYSYIEGTDGETVISNIPKKGSNTIDIWFQSKDSDKDGILDDEDSDRDADGLDDEWELKYSPDLTMVSDPNMDPDDDGLTNMEEARWDTNPFDMDTDTDGLTDSQEIELGTDPTLMDTDGDGATDGEEVEEGTDPLDETSTPKNAGKESIYEKLGLIYIITLATICILIFIFVVVPTWRKGDTEEVDKEESEEEETEPQEEEHEVGDEEEGSMDFIPISEIVPRAKMTILKTKEELLTIEDSLKRAYTELDDRNTKNARAKEKIKIYKDGLLKIDEVIKTAQSSFDDFDIKEDEEMI